MDFGQIKRDLTRIVDFLWRNYQTFELIPYEDENEEFRFFNKISDLELIVRLDEMSDDTREYLRIWLQIYRKFPERFRPKILVQTEKENKTKELFRREDLFMSVSDFKKLKILLTKNNYEKLARD